MKKIFLMCAFAGFTAFAASAQTEPTAAAGETKSAKKSECTRVCTEEEKAACTKMVSTKGQCCASGKASTTAMAAKTEKATAVSNKKVAAVASNKK